MQYKSDVCEERPKLNLVEPSPLQMRDVKFIVITDENSGAVFREMKKSEQKTVLFALDGNSYKSLSLNMDEIKNYIILLKEMINSYRRYYEEQSE